MSKNAHSQAAKARRGAIFTDEETHRVVAEYAADQGKKITRALREIVFSSPKVKRFLDKNNEQTRPVVE